MLLTQLFYIVTTLTLLLLSPPSSMRLFKTTRHWQAIFWLLAIITESTEVHRSLPLCNVTSHDSTDWSYLKGDNGKPYVGVLSQLCDVVDVAHLPMANSDQKAELYLLTQTCASAKDRIANIYADSRYVWECCGSNISSLLPVEIILKRPLCSEIIRCNTFTHSFNHY